MEHHPLIVMYFEFSLRVSTAQALPQIFVILPFLPSNKSAYVYRGLLPKPSFFPFFRDRANSGNLDSARFESS